MIKSRIGVLVGVIALQTLSAGVPIAAAETMGVNLSSATANDSVCNFKPEGSSAGAPEIRYCSVAQWLLDEDYAAPGRLEAPFNGTVIGWSVVAGPRSSNTGDIRLALRTGGREGPTYKKGPVYQGPEVLLPADAAPGSRIHFNENLPIEAGAQIALRIGITTRGNAEAAGAPLAFAAPGIATTETFLGGAGEPWPPGGGLLDTTEHQALLLETEIVSTEDTTAPIVQRRFAAHQVLRRGAVVQVRSSEAGQARATAKLRISGLAQSFTAMSKRIRVQPHNWTALGLRLQRKARRAVKSAEAEGRGVTLKGQVRVFDGAGNSDPLRFHVQGF